MNSSKYALLDAFDALSACPDPDSTWLCAVDIARSQGVDAINTGELDIPAEQLLWARSSMTHSWLETYVARDFARIDPLIALFKSPQTRQTIYCDAASVEQGRDGGHPILSKALSDAGYVLLHGTKFTTPGVPVGSLVTLCFRAIEARVFNASISNWTVLAALIGGFAMAPGEKSDRDVFAYGVPELTRREKQVLSLLATGLQTARIAETLDLAEITVSKHFRTARAKLGSATREQALIKAMQFRLLSF